MMSFEHIHYYTSNTTVDPSTWRPVSRSRHPLQARSLATFSSNCIKPVAKIPKARDDIAADGLAGASSHVGYHTFSRLDPETHTLSVMQNPADGGQSDKLTWSMNAVTTLSLGNFVAKFFTPSGLAIKLRNKMWSSGTPLALRTWTAMMADPPERH